eukprot:TCALIF_01814-PA protein Name:"Similar to TGFBI Transforming growth factor-beta-induced protein ig-h3 (Sus scrofa)" AED:0.12 eAED:0.12 QI:0/0.33/0/0.75/0.33/0.25/4/0/576
MKSIFLVAFVGAMAQVALSANLAEVASGAGFTKLVELVTAAGLADTLSNGGPFTVFAPTNEAFAKLSPETLDALGANPELLARVLKYHLVSGSVGSADLSDELVADSVEGTQLRFNNYQAGTRHSFFTVNGVRIVKTDVPADNGVIHVIDNVLATFADKSLPEVLQGDSRFSTLLAAVQAADLASTLSGEGPFTVFCPTNEAFEKLPAGTVEGLLQDKPALSKILLRHVVPKTIFANGIFNDHVTSVGGDQLTVSKHHAGVVKVSSNVDGKTTYARVIDADLIASNGVCHAIDTLGHCANIAELASQSGFTTLVDLVVKAGLADTLSNGGPFTVFAPTNEAFERVPKDILDKLGQDTELLKSVLLYHVVQGKVMSGQLSDELTANSVQGSPLRFNLFLDSQYYDGFFTVNGKRIINTDIIADNGIIHVVSDVIFPLTDDSIPGILTKDGRFGTLLTAVTAAGLVDTLSGDGPFTVFAPTDDAFAKIPRGTLEGLLQSKTDLTKVLLRHVLPDTLYSKGIHWDEVVTAGGAQIQTQLFRGGKVKIASYADGQRAVATVLEADIPATNGVVHVISDVI